MHATEHLLWTQITEGDATSFNQLFEQYWEPLFQYAWKITAHRQDAEELVQNLFIHLWQKHTTLPLVDSVSAYLFTALKNRLLNHLARKQPVLVSMDTLHETSLSPAHAATETRENEQLINTLVEQLPTKMRQVYVQHHQHGHSIREIAQATNNAEQTVRNQLNAALKKVGSAYKKSFGCFFFLP